MDVVDRLARRTARVEHQAVALVGNPALAREVRGNLDELPDELPASRLQLERARDVLARDDLQVRGCLRVDIRERDDPLVLEGELGRNLLCGDLAEEAVHGASLASQGFGRRTGDRAHATATNRYHGRVGELKLPERLLLGPGPSNVSEPVLRALAHPMIGHLDPAFLEVLDRVQAQLRSVFAAESALTLPISGTGSAGMEACFANLLEPGDRALIAVQGVFGERMGAVVERMGAHAIRVEVEMGEIIPPERLIAEIRTQRPDLVAMAHAARQAGARVILDCGSSLAGMDVRFDDWAIDAAYSGTQKCLACPPGLSPAAFGPRALERFERRGVPVQSWYLDLGLIGRYFGEERVYHHTAPVSMILALHAALERVLDEGLEARFARHLDAHHALVEGLGALGFEMLVDPAYRLPMLNAVIPPVEDEALIRRKLLLDYGIEIGGGLGKLAGRIWRIGLMGENARRQVVERLLQALRELL